MEHTDERKSGDPRQKNPTSAGRSEDTAVGPANTPANSPANASTSSGRSSDESDVPLFKPRPDQIGKPLTMGSNGGGPDSDIEGDGLDQSINGEPMKERKAS
jgi:hypothetical protein